MPERLPSKKWSAWLLPSARDVFFLLVFWSLVGGVLSNRPLADADVGWHIRAGEQMLATHTLFRSDPFSSTMQGQPWIAWEWLYDLVLGVLNRAAGLNGVVWLCGLLVAGTMTLLLSELLRNGTVMPLALLLTLLALASSAIHMYARPHIVSWLLTLGWFIVLERWEQGAWQGRAARWFFPLSMVLWVNLHGGWLLGVALVFIYVFAAWIESRREPDALAQIAAARRARALARTLAWTLAATVLNPHGWRLHAHIYRYLGDRYLMNRIDEFHSPDFHGWAERAFMMILVLTVFAFVGNSSKVRLSHMLVVLLAAYAGLIAARNLPVAGMLLALIAGPILWRNIAEIAERRAAWKMVRGAAGWLAAFGQKASARDLTLRGHLWPIVAVAATLVLGMQGGWLGSQRIVHAEFDRQRLPVAAAEFLSGERNRPPILATDNWGGYLIYRLYPGRQVVIDDRHDLYGAERFRDYLILMQGEPGWREVLEKWGIKTILLPEGSTTANLLRELPQAWRVAYEDKVAVVMERR